MLEYITLIILTTTVTGCIACSPGDIFANPTAPYQVFQTGTHLKGIGADDESGNISKSYIEFRMIVH